MDMLSMRNDKLFLSAAFAELQTDMTDLTKELDASKKPFYSYEDYTFKVLFPGNVDHVILHPPQVRIHLSYLWTASIRHITITNCPFRFAFSHLYLDVGNFFDKSTETTLHEVFVQVFLKFSDFRKPSQFITLIYEFTWLAGIDKSEENSILDEMDLKKTFYGYWVVDRCINWIKNGIFCFQQRNGNIDRHPDVAIMHFNTLLHNKHFLLMFIRTLERQKNFSIRDK